MDGNGRWAQKRGLPRNYGHIAGAKAFKKIVTYCKEAGIKYITFYAFSTENWKRPAEEVNEIMRLFNNYLDDVKKQANENIKVVFLGSKSQFSDEMRSKMIKLEKDSEKNDGMTLMLAINYGGRDDIIHAIKGIMSEGIKPEDITEDIVSAFLYTKGIPDVDFIIRPSGELRLSNFLIWQAAYAEYYFTDVLWPDFNKKELYKALDNYSMRMRRFGGI